MCKSNSRGSERMEPCFSCFFSYLLYGICVKIFIMNRCTCISKSYTTTKNTIDRQYTKRGKLQCQLLLIIGLLVLRPLISSLLQSATTVTTKCDSLQLFHYKVRHVLLQSTESIIKCDNFITKCDRN